MESFLVGATKLFSTFCLSLCTLLCLLPLRSHGGTWRDPLSFDKTAFIFLFCSGAMSASKQMLPYSRRPCLQEGRDEEQNKLSVVTAEPAVEQGDGLGCF